MACKLSNQPCPYKNDCQDCLYSTVENEPPKIRAATRKEYNREWMRRSRAAALESEMIRSGVA